jgi:hypothetical protein
MYTEDAEKVPFLASLSSLTATLFRCCPRLRPDRYKKSHYFEKRLDLQKHQEEESEPIDLWDVPESAGSKVMYFITFPLVALMVFTMADVRKEGKEKYYPFTFFMAIAWCDGALHCTCTCPVLRAACTPLVV